MNDPCPKCRKRNVRPVECLPCTDAAAGKMERQRERRRIRKALQAEVRDIKRLTPGEGGPGDVWVDAADAMYKAALRVLRR